MGVPTFPVVIELGGWSIQAHVLLEGLAYVLALRVYFARKRRLGDALAPETRWLLIVAATVGAALGSKLLAWLVDPAELARRAGDARWLWQQKTIVGGILGGWLAVELMKPRAGVRVRSGDLFAVPLALGIAVGRIGCFLAGLSDRTYGTPTSLFWGVDFGDGVARHPVQLYESAFAFGLAFVLARLQARPHAPGSVFRAFLIGYFGFRVLVEFLKPVPTFAGLTSLQWVSLFTCIGVLAAERWWRRERRAVTA